MSFAFLLPSSVCPPPQRSFFSSLHVRAPVVFSFSKTLKCHFLLSAEINVPREKGTYHLFEVRKRRGGRVVVEEKEVRQCFSFLLILLAETGWRKGRFEDNHSRNCCAANQTIIIGKKRRETLWMRTMLKLFSFWCHQHKKEQNRKMAAYLAQIPRSHLSPLLFFLLIFCCLPPAKTCFSQAAI